MSGLLVGTVILLFVGWRSIIHRVSHPPLAQAADAFGRGDFLARARILHDGDLAAVRRA
jgi:hypothetical protein